MYFDSPPSHSFHGSNSSHSKDNGLVTKFWYSSKYKLERCHLHLHRTGGRTYHIPNYATRYALSIASSSCPSLKTSTSYANEKSSMISVTFDEDKGAPRVIIIIVVIILLFAAVPVFLMACKTPKYMAEIPKNVEGSASSTDLNNWSKEQIIWVRDKTRHLDLFQ